MKNMFKALTTLVFLTFATTTFAQSTEEIPEEFCVGVANVAVNVANARDAGMPPKMAFQAIVSGGLNPEISYHIVHYVYVTVADLEPNVVGYSMYHLLCGEEKPNL